MKKILFPQPALRQEISTDTFKQLQNAIIELTTALMQGLYIDENDYTIVYGLEEIAGSPDWEISPGAIYHNGELYLCDGIDANDGGDDPVLTVVESAVGPDAKFSDDVSRTVHVDRKLVISFGALGSGDVDFVNLKRMDIAKKDQGVWTDINLEAQFSVVSGMKAQYRVDQFGIVHLRGLVNIDAGTSDVIAVAGEVPNAPVGIGTRICFIQPILGGAIDDVVRIEISSTGAVNLAAGGAAALVGRAFYLNGLSYAQEAY